ncbi:MAG TPA: hypothetical protein VFK56_02410 [Mycobacterium sp.]|nr:hypothetical protein [Mycobacterium sp.]
MIARLLEPYFHVSTLVQSNPAPSFEPAPGLRPNLLMGSWADPATGENKLIVVISQVADGERKAAELREMVMEEAPEDPSKADAYEIACQRPGEYVFVLSYVGRMTVLAGHCWIDVFPISVSVQRGTLLRRLWRSGAWSEAPPTSTTSNHPPPRHRTVGQDGPRPTV